MGIAILGSPPKADSEYVFQPFSAIDVSVNCTVELVGPGIAAERASTANDAHCAHDARALPGASTVPGALWCIRGTMVITRVCRKNKDKK